MMRRTTVYPTGIFMAVLLASVLWPGDTAAQQRTESPTSFMMLIAMPDKATQPVVMRLELAVESFATTALGATSASALAVERVIRTLADAGVARQDIESRGAEVLPEYTPRGVVQTTTIRHRPREIVGYWATTYLSVSLRDGVPAGVLIDLARGAGADLVRAVQTP